MSMAWINSWNNSKYRLTYSNEQSPPWKANLFSASQEIPHTVWNPQVHFAFTCASHLSLSWARTIQSMLSHPTSWRSILILSFHLCLSFSSGLIPSGFPTKTLYTPLLSPIHATFPTHLILLNLPQTIFGEEYRSLSSSLCSFLYSPATLSLLGPNPLLSALFSNTLSLHSSLNASNQDADPYKVTSKIIVFYISIFKFLDSKLKTKDSAPNDNKHVLT